MFPQVQELAGGRRGFQVRNSPNFSPFRWWVPGECPPTKRSFGAAGHDRHHHPPVGNPLRSGVPASDFPPSADRAGGAGASGPGRAAAPRSGVSPTDGGRDIRSPGRISRRKGRRAKSRGGAQGPPRPPGGAGAGRRRPARPPGRVGGGRARRKSGGRKDSHGAPGSEGAEEKRECIGDVQKWCPPKTSRVRPGIHHEAVRTGRPQRFGCCRISFDRRLSEPLPENGSLESAVRRFEGAGAPARNGFGDDGLPIPGRCRRRIRYRGPFRGRWPVSDGPFPTDRPRAPRARRCSGPARPRSRPCSRPRSRPVTRLDPVTRSGEAGGDRRNGRPGGVDVAGPRSTFRVEAGNGRTRRPDAPAADPETYGDTSCDSWCWSGRTSGARRACSRPRT